jgi:hypothetical protein
MNCDATVEGAQFTLNLLHSDPVYMLLYVICVRSSLSRYVCILSTDSDYMLLIKFQFINIVLRTVIRLQATVTSITGVAYLHKLILTSHVTCITSTHVIFLTNLIYLL